jgi:hypothetical protein
MTAKKSAVKVPTPCVFPRNIDGMVEVQQQAFAAVEKSEAERIVVDECGQRAQHDVDHAEAGLCLSATTISAPSDE